MTYVPDLDAYFERIGYGGDTRPTLATLNAIIFAHVNNVPFENLDVLLGRGIDLDPAAVERKLVHRHRGGYCFEHNSLLLHVLATLGYRVTPLSARVRIGRPRTVVTPRTHVFLKVELDGAQWLADVGVGALSPTAAFRLDTSREQTTPHEARRIERTGRWGAGDLRDPDARMYHQVRLDDQWHDVYDFTLEQMPAVDRLAGNWFTSTHPDSHFLDKLIVARATPQGRISLLNRTFKVRDREGQSVARTLASPDVLLEVLSAEFGLHFPEGTRFACAGLEWTD